MNKLLWALFAFYVAGCCCVCGVMEGAETKLYMQLGHRSGGIYSVAFAPDGRWALTGGWDGTARVWDVATGREIRCLQGDHLIMNSMAFSPDGRRVLTGSGDTARLWDVDTGKEIQRFNGRPDWVKSVAFSPEGPRVLTVSADGKAVRLRDMATGKELQRFRKHSGQVYSLAFSSDGRMLLTGSGDKTARVWDVATGRELRRFKGHTDEVTSAAFSPDGRWVLTGSSDNTARVWEVATGKELRRFEGHPDGVTSVAFAPGGRWVLTGSVDKTARMWDALTGQEIRRLAGHSDLVHSVTFSLDGHLALTGSSDNSARVWDVATGMEIQRLEGYSQGRVNSVAFSPDGRWAMTGSEDKTARVWDLTTGRETRRLQGHSGAVRSVAFSPDGRLALTGSEDKTARIWDVASGQELRHLEGHSDVVTSVAFSDGDLALTGSDDKTARLWEVATGKEIGSLEGHSIAVSSVAATSDGLWALTGSWDRTAGAWDLTTGQVRLLQGHSLPVISVALSRDGRLALTGSWDNTARVWELATGKELQCLKGHSDFVMSVAFSPNGHLALTGSVDNTVRVWEVATGMELRCLKGHSDIVRAVAFSPDGHLVLSGSTDGTTKLWDATTGKWLVDLVSFHEGGWAVVDPNGRFDTSNLDGGAPLHWIVDDDPMHPLPLEIFMRDYYTPRLLPRVLGGDKLPPLPSIAQLNRVQPSVAIAKIETEKEAPDLVTVTTEVARAERDFGTGTSKITRETGVYDLRLFRNGQIVGQVPTPPDAVPSGADDLARWRADSQVSLDPTTGKATIRFAHIRLPHNRGAEPVAFSAYAFNEDRVKSATARTSFEIPMGLPPAKGRAYVVAMGVNTHESHAWDLRFAANDARKVLTVVVDRLMNTGAFVEVVPVALVSDSGTPPEAGEAPATKANLKAVLDLLAGRAVAPEVGRMLPTADRILKAKPEDLVVLSFSGHGYAGERGVFYLLPSDIGKVPVKEVTSAVLQHAISSSELTAWLRDVDGGDMAMIVDACHSAASVEGEGFKPGPMGSQGLGQLAYDKGMRILAASQADDVALEIDLLQEGLLSYALVHDGLEARQADFQPQDGHITLAEWLAYAVERVPVLCEEVKAGKVQSFGLSGVRGVFVQGSLEKKGILQQPSLFDFAIKQHDVLLVR